MFYLIWLFVGGRYLSHVGAQAFPTEAVITCNWCLLIRKYSCSRAGAANRYGSVFRWVCVWRDRNQVNQAKRFFLYYSMNLAQHQHRSLDSLCIVFRIKIIMSRTDEKRRSERFLGSLAPSINCSMCMERSTGWNLGHFCFGFRCKWRRLHHRRGKTMFSILGRLSAARRTGGVFICNGSEEDSTLRTQLEN